MNICWICIINRFWIIAIIFLACAKHTTRTDPVALRHLPGLTLSFLYFYTSAFLFLLLAIFFSVPLVSVHSGTMKEMIHPNRNWNTKTIVEFGLSSTFTVLLMCVWYFFNLMIAGTSLVIYKMFSHLLQCMNLPTNPMTQNRWSLCFLLAEELTEIFETLKGRSSLAQL